MLKTEMLKEAPSFFNHFDWLLNCHSTIHVSIEAKVKLLF